MPVLKIPTPLRYYTAGQTEVMLNGDNVHKVMQDLVQRFPELKSHLYDQDGDLRAFVNLYLGEDNVKDLQGMQTPVGEGDTLRLVPSIAGGHDGSSDLSRYK
jgi:adenylyltransferase/sulfurtransferase